ncbi:hypothetical protein [Hydrogenophaga aromaticivorans]|uniref:hypothetical protein n=1 Tax=Hydrogenophaga aromaticivorans TaxID=2610898 RepID=UPI001FFDA882|nr:hypothetical protein [Hydrogenophaga aromaticivorans]
MLEELCGKCGMPYSVRSSPTHASLTRCASCGCATGIAPLEWSKKQPEAYQPFLSLVKRALSGEAQELRPPNRLAIIESAVNSFNGSIAHFADLFCSWWGVDRPDDLCRWFGASLTQEVLVDTLMRRRWVDPKLAVIAVTSFAQEWLRQGGTDVQEPLRFTAISFPGQSGVKKSIESELAERAAEAGIPERRALRIAAGKAFPASWLRSAEGFALLRFVDSLPQHVREIVEKRHGLKQAMRKKSSTRAVERLAAIEYLREIVQFVLSSEPRSTFRRNNPSLTIWFNRYDRMWLHTQLEDRSFRSKKWKSLEAARKEFSSNLVALLARNPAAGIVELSNQNIELNRVLSRQDSAWYEAQIDSFRQVTYQNRLREAVSQRRDKFLASVHDSLLSFTEVSLRVKAAQRWLRLYDSAWLKEQMPKIEEAQLKRKILEQRVAVTAGIAQGCKSRGEFGRTYKALHDWMEKRDRAWFDVQLPETKVLTPR